MLVLAELLSRLRTCGRHRLLSVPPCLPRPSSPPARSPSLASPRQLLASSHLLLTILLLLLLLLHCTQRHSIVVALFFYIL